MYFCFLGREEGGGGGGFECGDFSINLCTSVGKEGTGLKEG